MALYLTESDVRQLLTMALALAAVEDAHRAHARGRAIDIARQRTRVPTASLHILQGALLDDHIIGYKAYTVSKEGARFLVHLFDARSGAPLAILEADYLGMMRTGAAAGIAAHHLARHDADTVGMIGAGWQAQSQLEALCAVRPIRQVKLYSRHPDRCRRASADFAERFGIDVVPVERAEEAVQGSAIVVTATTASAPVVCGDWLEPGMHLNAVGSNALIRRELDESAVGKADVICVDSRATAVREAGDLLPALEKGRLCETQWIELGELVAGHREGRLDARAITLFESQGMAIQDLAVAHRLVELARSQGIGKTLSLFD